MASEGLKSFSIYPVYQKAFSFVINGIRQINTLLFLSNDTPTLEFISKELARLSQDIKISLLNEYTIRQLISFLFQNNMSLSIFLTIRELYRLLLDTLLQISIDFVIRTLLKFVNTSLHIGFLTINFSMLLAQFLTLAYHDPYYLSNRDVLYLSDMDSVPA